MDLCLEKVLESFTKKNISTDVILSNVKLLDSSSKNSPAYNDPKYFPFFYRLGCEVNPKKVIQIGSKLGLVGSSFLKGCKNVEEWHVFDDENCYKNIIDSNLRLSGCSKIFFESTDLFNESFLFAELGLLTEKYDLKKMNFCLEFLWKNLKSECYLVVDYVEDPEIKENFYNFCFIKNRKPVLFNTRYGVGIIKK